MNRFSGMGLTANPRVNALVMCDRIILEEGTRKLSLIDMFTTVNARQLPSVVRMCLFVSLTKGTNDADEVFVGLFSPSDATIVQAGMKIEKWDGEQMEIPFPPQPVQLTEEGDYDLRVFVAGDVLAQRKLTVRIVQPPEVEGPIDSPTPSPAPS